LSERETGYVNRALESGWISGTGSYVGDFERLLASHLQGADVVAVCSGTSALELALRALDVGPGLLHMR
jgi:dTDP-4-amino-4,6-dideoxygalactose transaminase